MPLSKSATNFKQGLQEWYLTGLARVSEGFFQSLQIVVAGIGAYAFALHVLGHKEPIFAATAAIVSLGYVRGATHARRMLEVTIGVTLGILIGDTLMLVLGRGLWQAALVLFISILVARFLDNGIIFTIQMGLQSCLVVLMAPIAGGPFSRSLDAIVGGAFAFLMMFLFPKDPRTTPRMNIKKLMDSYAAVLQQSAQAIQDYNSSTAWQALEKARDLQPLYNAAEGDVITAKGMAQLSMLGKNHLKELREFSQALDAIDLAIRNTRVLNRRLASTISHVQISQTAIKSIAQAFESISRTVTELGLALTKEQSKTRQQHRQLAQTELIELAKRLDPRLMGVRTLEAESLVLMLRPLVTDLLEATGLSHESAADLLVPLGESMTEHAPRTNQLELINPKRAAHVARWHSKGAGAAEPEDQLAPDDTRALNIVLRSQQNKKR
ncbi:MAG: FUSC family protein [Rothia sp. (in: high G+C Gram-positive bacteria)]|nr:FUSC family protein [Rothia sp. (in: high G+C Gram-positive bacteria)]